MKCENEFCQQNNPEHSKGCNLTGNIHLCPFKDKFDNLKIRAAMPPEGEVANVWTWEEFEVSERTEITAAVYQFILRKNGTAIFYSDEYTRQDSDFPKELREELPIIVAKLNLTDGQWIDVNVSLPQHLDNGKADKSEKVFTKDKLDAIV